MSKGDGFLRMRNGIMPHLERGWMDEHMFTAYTIMLAKCDYATGIWKGSADALVAAVGGQWSVRTAQDVIRRLSLGLYITSKHERGKRGNYPILINNYEPQKGQMKGKRLRKTTTRLWSEHRDPTSNEPESDATNGVTSGKVTREVTQEATQPIAGNQDSLSASLQASNPTPQDRTQDQNQVNKEASEASFASLTTLDAAGGRNQNQPEVFEQERKQDQHLPEVCWQEATPTAKALFDAVYPVRTDQLLARELRYAQRAADILDACGVIPGPLVRYNKSHKRGRLVFHSCRQVLSALQSHDMRIVNDWLTHDGRGCPACKGGLECVQKQTPPPAPIKFDYRAITKEEERRFTKDFRGEGWEVGALNRLTRDNGWPIWGFNAAILHVLKTRTNPISYDDFLALAQSVPQP
jgi:hypothetical protein